MMGSYALADLIETMRPFGVTVIAFMPNDDEEWVAVVTTAQGTIRLSTWTTDQLEGKAEVVAQLLDLMRTGDA